MNMSEFDGSQGKGYKAATSILGITVRVLIAVLVIVLLIYLGKTAYILGYEAFSQKTVAGDGEGIEVVVTVTEDMDTSDIWEVLTDAGLIDESAAAFRLQDLIFGIDGEILPGTYTLSTSMTVNEMYQVMSKEPEEEEDA